LPTSKLHKVVGAKVHQKWPEKGIESGPEFKSSFLASNILKTGNIRIAFGVKFMIKSPQMTKRYQ
jgi:hypothetical protein